MQQLTQGGELYLAKVHGEGRDDEAEDDEHDGDNVEYARCDVGVWDLSTGARRHTRFERVGLLKKAGNYRIQVNQRFGMMGTR